MKNETVATEGRLWIDRTVTTTVNYMWRGVLGDYEDTSPHDYHDRMIARRVTTETEGWALGAYPAEGDVYFSSDEPDRTHIVNVDIGPWVFDA